MTLNGCKGRPTKIGALYIFCCERNPLLPSRSTLEGVPPAGGGVSACEAGRDSGVLSRSALTFAKLLLRAVAEQSLLDFFYVNTIMIIGGSSFA